MTLRRRLIKYTKSDRRDKEGRFIKGNIPWIKGKKIWLNKNHPKGMLGKYQSKETKDKISQSMIKQWKEGKRRISRNFIEKSKIINRNRIPWNKGIKIDIKNYPDYGMLNKHHSKETIENIRNNKERILKIKKARKKQVFPKYLTNPELRLIRIIRKHNLPYKYTGNGSFWIGNVNPDFVNCNGQKICIEVWGDYWHNREDMKKKDIERLETLQKYGWQRMIFWEHELNGNKKVNKK